MGDVSFPVFLHSKDDKPVEKYDSLQELQSDLEPIDVENEEYDCWDIDGFRVVLLIRDPKSRDWLVVERHGEKPAREEVLRAFAEFAAVERADFTPPANPEDLLQAYEILWHNVRESRIERSWVKRFLARFLGR